MANGGSPMRMFPGLIWTVQIAGPEWLGSETPTRVYSVRRSPDSPKIVGNPIAWGSDGWEAEISRMNAELDAKHDG